MKSFSVTFVKGTQNRGMSAALRRLATRQVGKVLAVSTLFAFVAASAHAATYNWDPSMSGGVALGGTGNWDLSDAFWYLSGTGDVVWPNTNTSLASFDGTASTVTLTSPIVAGGLIFTTTGYTITGSATNFLTLDTGGIDASALTGGTTTISAPIAMSAAQTWTAGTGSTLAVSGAVDNGGFLFTTAGAGATTLSGILSGAGGLTVVGTGRTTLSGTNTYTGGTTVSAGNLTLSGTGDVGTGPVSVNGGVLQLGVSTTTNGNAALALSNAVTLASGTALNIYQTNASNLTYNAFPISMNGNSSLNFYGGNTHTSNIPSAIVLNNTSGTQTATIGENDAQDTVNLQGIISGTGDLTISPGGNGNAFTVTINQAETYAGNTFITQTSTFDHPVLKLLAGGSLPAATGLTLTAGTTKTAQFDLNGQSQTIASLATLGTAANDSIINSAGTAATLTINNAAADTVSGLITGTLLGLTKTSVGTLTLSGANTYTGDTVVSAGTLALGNALALQSSALNYNNQGGTVDFGALTAVTLGGLKGAQNLPSSSLTTLTLNPPTGATPTYSGILSDNAGALSLIKTGAGTQTLAGASTYTGKTTISAGNLNAGIADGTGTGALGSGGTITFSGGTLQYSGTNTQDYSSRISGSGSSISIDPNGSTVTFSTVLPSTNTGGLTKAGTGTLILTAANAYTGATTIAGGTLVSANTAALGTVAGGVTYSGTANGTLDIQTDGTGDNAYPITLGTGTAGTIASDVKTGTVGINHTLGALKISTVTLNIVKGLNVLSGTPSITFPSLNLSAGASGTSTVNPTTANLSIGTVNIGQNGVAKTLQLDGTSTGNTITGLISNNLSTVTLIKANTSTWKLSGANTFTGGTTVTGGTLQAGSATAFGPTSNSMTVNGGIVDLNNFGIGTGILAGTGGTLLNNAAGTVTLTVGSGNATGSYAGVIADNNNAGTGKLAVSKNGTGTQTLTGVNTYSGGTTINSGGGILLVTSSGGLGTGNVLLAHAGTAAGVLQLSGGITLTNTFTANSANSLSNGAPGLAQIENVSGNNTLSGNMTIVAAGGSGELIQSDAGLLTISGTLANTVAASNRTFDFGGVGNGLVTGVIQDTSSTVTSLVQKDGVGTWTLTGANTYTGGTSVVAGTLSGTTTSLQGNITDSAKLDFTQSANGTYAGVISGTGAVTKGGNPTSPAGTGGVVTMTGANTYSGGTTVSAGALSGPTQAYSTGGVTVNTGATADYTQNTASTYAASITGTGSVTVGANPGGGLTPGGTITYTGVDGATGGTTVKAGSLLLNHTGGGALTGPVAIATGGTVGLGSDGQIAATSNVTLTGGTLAANAHNEGAASGGVVSSPGAGSLQIGNPAAAATDSTLDFGDVAGANPTTLVFGDSSSLTWNGTVTLANYTDGTDQLYIGATNDLTPSQLSSIKFGGFIAGQNANGKITFAPAPEPNSLLSLLVGGGVLGSIIVRKRRQNARKAA